MKTKKGSSGGERNGSSRDGSSRARSEPRLIHTGPDGLVIPESSLATPTAIRDLQEWMSDRFPRSGG